MFDTSSVLYAGKRLWICRYEGCDYTRKAPWFVRFNPLRIEIGWRTNTNAGPRWYINRNGRWQIKWSDFNWWLWKRRYRERLDRIEKGDLT